MKSILAKMSKRKYLRKPSDVSATEKAIGVAVLLALVGIGGAVYWKGQRYDDGVFFPDEESIEQVEGGGGESEPPPRVPLNLELDGWSIDGEVDTYDAENLYLKINGRDDLYHSYDVERLDFASYVGTTDGSRFVDLYVYDMAEPRNAFGIFSVERTPGASPLELGRGGYEVGGSLFYWHGRFYNQIIASDGSDESIVAARHVAELVETLQLETMRAGEDAALALGGLFHDSVFARGRHFGGVTEAEDAAGGADLAARLNAHLERLIDREAVVRGARFEDGREEE